MNCGKESFSLCREKSFWSTVLVEVVEARATSPTHCLLKDKAWPPLKGTYMTWITIIKIFKTQEFSSSPVVLWDFFVVAVFFKKGKERLKPIAEF